MKTEILKFNDTLSIEPFNIESLDFVGIVQKCGRNAKNVNIIVGDLFSKVRTHLENITEIENHSSQIEIPFSLKIDGTELTVWTNSASISYIGDDATLAKSLRLELLQFRPWYRFIYGRYANLLSVFMLVLLVLAIDRVATIDFVTKVFVVFIPASFIIYFSQIQLKKNELLFQPRGSFLKRNRDAIILNCLFLVIGSLFGWSLANFGSLVNYFRP